MDKADFSYLILVRHGLTDWNKEGKWQGFTDIPINEEGKKEARKAAEAVRDIKIDSAYTSSLTRTKQTYQEICDVLGLSCPVLHHDALNERDYGIYTGKNKWEVQKEIGSSEFEKLRRGFDYPIPAGETLRDVHGRVVPFYEKQILADLKSGKNVMVVSSGNTLRALMKHLENISDKDVATLELGFGDVYVFKVSREGHIISKEVRAKDLFQGKH